MNSRFAREYWILKTNSGDAIGLVSMIRPTTGAAVCEFSLHRPECKDTDSEFIDLLCTSIDFPEFETHRDAFGTLAEIEVIKEWETTIMHSVLVKKPEKKNATRNTDKS